MEIFFFFAKKLLVAQNTFHVQDTLFKTLNSKIACSVKESRPWKPDPVFIDPFRPNWALQLFVCSFLLFIQNQDQKD